MPLDYCVVAMIDKFNKYVCMYILLIIVVIIIIKVVIIINIIE